MTPQPGSVWRKGETFARIHPLTGEGYVYMELFHVTDLHSFNAAEWSAWSSDAVQVWPPVEADANIENYCDVPPKRVATVPAGVKTPSPISDADVERIAELIFQKLWTTPLPKSRGILEQPQ